MILVLEDLDYIDCLFEKVVRDLSFEIGGQDVEQMVYSELAGHMDYVRLATLEEVHNFWTEFDVQSLLHDKALEDFLSWLFLCHWVLHDSKYAGQARHDIWVRRDACEDKEDCHEDLCFIRRRYITIADRTDRHYCQVARSDIAGCHGLVIDAQGRYPAYLIVLGWEKGDYWEDAANDMDQKDHSNKWR